MTKTIKAVLFISILFQINSAILGQVFTHLETLQNSTLRLYAGTISEPTSLQANYNTFLEDWTAYEENELSTTSRSSIITAYKSNQHQNLRDLKKAIQISDQDLIKKLTIRILLQARALHVCNFGQEFYLDDLLELKSSYDHIHQITHDELLDLYEWNEFEWHFAQFTSSYKEINRSSKFTLPLIQRTSLRNKLADVKECIQHMAEAMKTGQRTEVIRPCDHLGQAIDEVIIQHVEILEYRKSSL